MYGRNDWHTNRKKKQGQHRRPRASPSQIFKLFLKFLNERRKSLLRIGHVLTCTFETAALIDRNSIFKSRWKWTVSIKRIVRIQIVRLTQK
jgi:hypothetical protein